jgi:hypothetical protein
MLVLFVTALVMVAVFKPWQPDQAPATARGDPAGQAARGGSDGRAGGIRDSAAPSPDASLRPGVRREQCQNPDAWRIVTVERSGPLHTRTLLPVTPVAAAGPSDPAIEARPFHAAELIALGYCVPVVNDPDLAATEAGITLWRRSAAGPAAVLHNAPVLDQALAGIGEVYLGPAPALHAATWPDGTYVFEVPDALPGGVAGWFALDFSGNAGVAPFVGVP